MVLTQLPRRVVIAPPVITTVTWVKDRVCPAVPVNLMMLLVLLNANLVPRIRITVIKEEHQVVIRATMVRCPRKVVPNVKIVVLEGTVTGVKHA
jgi:hypothetical protein